MLDASALSNPGIAVAMFPSGGFQPPTSGAGCSSFGSAQQPITLVEFPRFLPGPDYTVWVNLLGID
jgi:hypothetical protein